MARQQLRGYASSLWWLLVVISVLLVIFGLVTLFYPGLTLAGLVGVFAVFAVIYGVAELFEGFSAVGRRGNWWLALVIGILFVILGVYLAKNPTVALATFAALVGWFLLVRGIVDVLVGLFYTDARGHHLHWYITGILGIAGGIAVWLYPLGGTIAFSWVLGVWALVVGVVTLSKALAARDLLES